MTAPRTSTQPALRLPEEQPISADVLLDQAPMGVAVLDGSGMVQFTNPTTDSLFGVCVGDLIGRPLPISDEQRPLLNDTLAQVQRTGLPRSLEVRCYRPDATTLELAVSVRPVPRDMLSDSGAVLWLTDQTPLKRDVETLRGNDHRFREIAALIQDALWMIDWATQRIIYVSPAYETIWGRKIAGLYAEMLDWVEGIHPDDRERVRNSFLTQIDQGPWEEEYRVLRPDGSVRWVRDRAIPIRDRSGCVVRIAGIAEDVTDRKGADDALRRSEARFQELFDRSPDPILVYDTHGKILDANPAASRLYGLDRSQLVGLLVSRLAPPDRQQQAIEEFARFVHGQLEQLESVHQHSAGRAIPVELRARRLDYADRSAVLVHIRDITERKRAMHALHASEERFRMLAEKVRFIPWEMDVTTWQFFYVGPQAVAILGYPAEEWKADGFWVTHLHADDYDRVVKQQVNAIRHSVDFEWEYRMVAQDGHSVWFHHIGHVVRKSGRAILLRGVMIDITERKNAEEERLALETHVQQVQKMESLGILAGGIAHDLKNMLFSVLGYADMALTELPGPSPARGYVEQMVVGAERASELTQQLLSYAGRSPANVCPLSLNDLIAEMGRLLLVSVSKNCELGWHLAPDLPAIVGDAGQIRQIVMNLIINASDALKGQPGSITLRTGVRDYTVTELTAGLGESNLKGGRYVQLEVTDTGEGMAPETLQKIFDPFFSTKGPGKGYGLGLSAVLGIVKAHGGAVWVSSELGRGTTFRILIPASNAPLPAPKQEEADEPRTGVGTVLVIDDEETVRRLAEVMLTKLGFTVLAAPDGTAGLETFQTLSNGIDLVILDLTMPGLSGQETLRQLRNHRADVPVILSSGYSQPPSHQGLDGAAPTGFLRKPYRIEELWRVIREALRMIKKEKG